MPKYQIVSILLITKCLIFSLNMRYLPEPIQHIMNYTILKDIRKGKGIKLNQLETITGIPRERIGRIERGQANPKLNDIEAICKALGLTVALLVI